MKIRSVETTIARLPFTHGGPPTGFGGVAWGTIDVLLVEVKTDQGLSGWGEAFGFNVSPATQVVIDTMIAPLIVGQDPTAIDEIGDMLQRKLHLFGRNGPVVYGVSGIDIALWDLAGKAAGMPIHHLLHERFGGPPVSGRVEAYASLLRYGTPEFAARNVRRALDDGYRAIKLHETDERTIRAACECAGSDVRMMLDTNCPWSLDEAKARARQLEPLDLHWLEEPIWPPEDSVALASLRAEGRVRVAAGENAGNVVDFKRMLDAKAVDFIQPSVIKCGGLSAMLEIVQLAAQAGVRVAPHSPYFGPGFIATLHLNAWLQQDVSIERLYVDLPENLYGAAIHPEDGFLTVPAGAGLGLDPDPAVLARYRASNRA
jgi:L-alanine-DL-glutamate epimerase-like enolase superfamily enzyme